MPYQLLGLGATSYVTTTDNKTVLKGYRVWRDGKYYIGRDDCEDDLAREAAIYAHLGAHQQILKCFGLEQHCAGVHSLRLDLAPLGARSPGLRPAVHCRASSSAAAAADPVADGSRHHDGRRLPPLQGCAAL